MKSDLEKGKQMRNCWGHEFEWTENHKGPEELNELLQSYDKIATDALDIFDEISPPNPGAKDCPFSGHRDLFSLLEQNADKNPLLGKLWNDLTVVPDWVDWDQLLRGQQVVYRYGVQSLLGLMHQSLVGGMGAWRVVETLTKTGGFSVEVCHRRLLETLHHFKTVIEDLDDIKPGGGGFVSTIRVRFLHSTVRRKIMRLEEESPGYHSYDKYGVPINDLHQMGTIGVYSVALLYLGLPRQGVTPTHQECVDYVALWRYVAHLIGTPTDWMSTPEKAKAMLESILLHEFAPSSTSQILANNILTAEAWVPPIYFPRKLLAAQTYRLNGKDLAKALDVKKPGLGYRLFVDTQCVMLKANSAMYPMMPGGIKKVQNKIFRAITTKMLHDEKTGLKNEVQYDFKFVPKVGMATTRGTSQDAVAGKLALRNEVKVGA